VPQISLAANWVLCARAEPHARKAFANISKAVEVAPLARQVKFVKIINVVVPRKIAHACRKDSLAHSVVLDYSVTMEDVKRTIATLTLPRRACRITSAKMDIAWNKPQRAPSWTSPASLIIGDNLASTAAILIWFATGGLAKLVYIMAARFYWEERRFVVRQVIPQSGIKLLKRKFAVSHRSLRKAVVADVSAMLLIQILPTISAIQY
jgi:hypothetical protein